VSLEIPRTFAMPGNYRVRVHFLPHAELQRLAKAAADEVVWAYFDPRNTGGGRLYLTSGRHPMLLSLDFEHEMGHVVTEWRDWWMRKWGVERAVTAAASHEEEGGE
jgi:hypothetical protein